MIQVDGTVDFDDLENTVDEGSAESNQILYDVNSDIIVDWCRKLLF